MTMFGATRSAANSHAKVGIETGLHSASPHKPIAMLFDGALAVARLSVKSGDIAARRRQPPAHAPMGGYDSPVSPFSTSARA